MNPYFQEYHHREQEQILGVPFGRGFMSSAELFAFSFQVFFNIFKAYLHCLWNSTVNKKNLFKPGLHRLNSFLSEHFLIF